MHGAGIFHKQICVGMAWDQRAIQDAMTVEDDREDEVDEVDEGDEGDEDDEDDEGDEGDGKGEGQGAVDVAGSATMVDCRVKTGRMGQASMAMVGEALAAEEEHGTAPAGVEGKY